MKPTPTVSLHETRSKPQKWKARDFFPNVGLKTRVWHELSNLKQRFMKYPNSHIQKKSQDQTIQTVLHAKNSDASQYSLAKKLAQALPF